MKHFESNQDIVNAETRILTIGRTVTVNYTKEHLLINSSDQKFYYT